MTPTRKQETTVDEEWDASGEEWETANTGGLGEKIDWADDPVFEGIYLGPVQGTDKFGQELDAFSFKGDDGREYFAWASYQLSQGLQEVDSGRRVRIEFLGKREIKGRAGQYVSLFSVKHRPA